MSSMFLTKNWVNILSGFPIQLKEFVEQSTNEQGYGCKVRQVQCIQILINTKLQILLVFKQKALVKQTYCIILKTQEQDQLIHNYCNQVIIIKQIAQNNQSMSKRKQDKKISKKDREKDLQRQKMQQQQAKRQKQRLQAQKRIQVLQNSGILDAYQYFLRAICKNGLPEANIFQFAAQQILKYQKKMKQQQGKKQQIKSYNKSLVEQSSSRIEKSQEKLKPSVLPFKGEVSQQALKALKKK